MEMVSPISCNQPKPGISMQSSHHVFPILCKIGLIRQVNWIQLEAVKHTWSQ